MFKPSKTSKLSLIASDKSHSSCSMMLLKHSSQQQQSDNNNNSSSNAEVAEDYETCKVSKSKKSQYDADVRMVQDLDRWG